MPDVQFVERINAGLAAARERGAKLGRPRTLDRHVSSVANLSKRGMSGRKIAAKLNIAPWIGLRGFEESKRPQCSTLDPLGGG
jgi:DNA invertase Pin-like site-specific DNA recombinase